MKKALAVIAFLSCCLHVHAQSLDDTLGNFLRQSDKLYVVISVLATILAGLILFLIMQDKRISRIEKQLKDKKP